MKNDSLRALHARLSDEIEMVLEHYPKNDGALKSVLRNTLTRVGSTCEFVSLQFTKDSPFGTCVEKAWNDIADDVPHATGFYWDYLEPAMVRRRLALSAANTDTQMRSEAA